MSPNKWKMPQHGSIEGVICALSLGKGGIDHEDALS